jgi:copper(I)-binding protein
MMRTLLAPALGLTTLLMAGAAIAAPSAIVVRGAWIRATPNGATTAAGYLSAANSAKSDDRLMGGTSPAARELAPHHMSIVGGVMRMSRATAGLPVPAGGTLTLAPSGDHLMLIGLTRPLKTGDHVRAVLTFANAGKVAVDFQVRATAPAPPPKTGGMAGMDMR